MRKHFKILRINTISRKFHFKLRLLEMETGAPIGPQGGSVTVSLTLRWWMCLGRGGKHLPWARKFLPHFGPHLYLTAVLNSELRAWLWEFITWLNWTITQKRRETNREQSDEATTLLVSRIWENFTMKFKLLPCYCARKSSHAYCGWLGQFEKNKWMFGQDYYSNLKSHGLKREGSNLVRHIHKSQYLSQKYLINVV